MDEPSHYGPELFDIREMMGSRLTSDRGPNTMFWSLTGNGYNAAWKILEQREDINGDPINDRISVERASVLDNPYIDEAAKEQLRRRYGGTSRAEQALFGGFAAAQGLVYSDFSRDAHVIPHSEADDLVGAEWRMYGYDAGWNDPRILLELGKTSYDQLVVLDEFYRSGAHVSDAIEWLESKNKPEGIIYAEHVPDEIEKFRQAGWTARKANKDLDAGIAEVRKRFSSGGNLPTIDPRSRSRETGAQLYFTGSTSSRNSSHSSFPSPTGPEDGHFQPDPDPDPDRDGSGGREDRSRVGLLISDRCQHLIRELLGYKEEHVGKSTADDHCVDSLRYAVHTISSDSTSSGTRLRMIKTDPW